MSYTVRHKGNGEFEGKIKPGKHEFGETDWIEVFK